LYRLAKLLFLADSENFWVKNFLLQELLACLQKPQEILFL